MFSTEKGHGQCCCLLGRKDRDPTEVCGGRGRSGLLSGSARWLVRPKRR